MISQGINTASTIFLVSISGIFGTGAPIGVAPMASISHAPVRVGVRIFRPTRSSAVRIGLWEWNSCPA